MAFIDAINNPITREIQKDYNRAIAQKIRNRLQQLENANDKDKRRWVWELLQNASDTVNVNDRTVDIEMIVTEDFIEFKHNGGYFSPRNITNLVHQISSKEGEDSIGRFGTGFLTTHTLSRTVEVQGIFTENEDYYDFKVRLNRTGNTEIELIKGIEETWDAFYTHKLAEKPDNIVWSSFKYINQNKAVATETLNDFITFIHYNLAFVPSIGNVKVIDEVKDYHFSVHKKSVEKINDLLSILTFEVNENNNIFEKTLLIADNAQIQAAIEIDITNNTIIPIAKNIPRLFCAFPLIGTENFTFPMVLNSRNFSPKTERDGVYLKGDTTQANRNKPLLEDVLPLYYAALEFSYNQKIGNLYLLAQHENSFQDDYFDTDWYEITIQKPIQNRLLISPIVKTETGEFQTIKTIKFPYHTRDKKLDLRITQQIWEYQSVLYPDLIPQKSDIENWANIIWEDCNRVSLKGFANYIQKFENVDNLLNAFNNIEIEVFTWLNEVIGFYIENGFYLLNQYKICPNQEKENQGRFCLKDELYADDDIQEELKNIYEIFTEITPWRKELLARQITTLQDTLKKEKKIRRRNNIMQGINARIEQEETDKKQIKKAVFGLLSLMPLKKEYDDEEKQIAHDKHILYRQDVYRFSKNLFQKEIPENIIVDNLSTKTWELADKWALDYLVKKVTDLSNINDLSKALNFNAKKETSDWLNELFIFFIKEDKRNYFSDKIFPNQLGYFSYKSSLYQDENIAEEFKDILTSLDELSNNNERKGWRRILLDKRITAFSEQSKLQSKTTQDISDEINKIIGNLSKIYFERLKIPMFKLVTLINSENQHQRKLWEYLRAFYLDEVPKQLQIVENATDFDWQPCFTWCIKHLIKDITDLKYVDELEDKLHGNIKILDWLADFIEFIHETEDYKKLLDGDEYAIIPNQNGSFQIKNRLYADIEIDEDLKKIIKLLNPNWLNDLLENSPIFVDLPKDRERTTVDTALEVDRIFRTYDDDAQKSEYVEAIRIISDWMYNGDEAFNKQYLDYVYNKEAELVVSTLGSRKKKDEVLQIIQSGKAPILSKIANDNNFSDYELEMVNANSKKVINFLNALNNPNSNETHIPLLSKNDEIKEKTKGIANSVDELIAEFLKLQSETIKEGQNQPKFTIRSETTGGTTDWDAVKESNELARERIKIHLSQIKENNLTVYDLSGWSKKTNTIIENIKKNGIQIGLVTKGADNEIIYFNSTEREFLSDTKKFTELWVHSNGKIFQITLGEILKMWNVQTIKTNMFDLK